MADAWVAPDSRPDEVSRPVGPPTPAVAPQPGRGSTDRVLPVPVPVPLRPMTVPDMLDGSLRILKLSPGTVVGLAAVATLPVQLVLGVLSRSQLEETDVDELFGDTFAGTADLGGTVDPGSFVAALVLEGLVLAWVAAGLAVLVTGWYTGRDHTLRELARAVGRRTVPLVVAWIAVHVLEAVALVGFLVGALVPMALFAVVSPVVACERVGPWQAMRRSSTLASRRFGAVLGVCLAAALVSVLLSVALTGATAIYVSAELPAAWVVNTVGAAAAGLVVTPFVAGVSVLLYLDLRIRTEGLDIQLAAAKQFAAS